jgi:hypothetical protein
MKAMILVPLLACVATLAQQPSESSSGAPAAPSHPATTQPIETSPRVRVEMSKLLVALQDPEPRVRQRAAGRAKNLAGEFADAVDRAAKDESLSEEARASLRAALPLLRHRAKQDAAAAAVRENDAKDRLECYGKFGKKDARWDAAVREAMAVRLGPDGDLGAVIRAYKKAIDAGCDDPLVTYLYARTRWLARDGDRDEVLELQRDAATALATSQYPAEGKCRAAARYIEQTGARHEQLWKVCRETVAAALAETKRSAEDVSDFAEMVYGALSRLEGPHNAFQRVYDAYSKARPLDAGPRVMLGQRYVEYAWEARGGDVAANVRREQWQGFHERLLVARKALEKAWELDPDDDRAPTAMITVAMGEGAPRREMEKWFARAMKANPDNRDACAKKLYYLYPRWHGSHAEMIAFGRECLATQNYWGPLPEVLYDAHMAVSREVPDAKAYLAIPAVWADLEAVHRNFLDIFPDSFKVPWYRSRLAKLACECQQWDAAVKAFEEIGDEPDLRIFTSKAVYNYYRKKATRRAGNVRQVSAE